MTQNKKEKYRKLPAKPIMIYPQSDEQRAAFVAAGEKSGRSMSAFIVSTVESHLANWKARLSTMSYCLRLSIAF